MMRVDVQQTQEMQPGEAALTVSGAEIGADALRFCIENPSLGFLQRPGSAKPWSSTMTWLSPASARADAGEPPTLRIVLGPEHTFHMKANVTYAVSLQDGAGRAARSRMSWPAIRLPSAAPSALTEEALAPRATPEVATAAAEPATATATATATGAGGAPAMLADPPPGRRRMALIAGSVAASLLVAAGGGAWWIFGRDAPPRVPTPQAAAEGPLGAPSARAYLSQQHGAAEFYAEARRYLKAGGPDAVQGALVLLNRAAADGSAPAQTALGEMYDPVTFDAVTSAMKAPDPEKALLWYERAAKAGDPRGTYRLGKLLMSGRVQAPGESPESGAAYLQKAAQLGDADARQDVDALKKGGG